MTVLAVLLTLASLVMAAWVHWRGAAVLTAGEVTEKALNGRSGVGDDRSAPPAVSAAAYRIHRDAR